MNNDSENTFNLTDNDVLKIREKFLFKMGNKQVNVYIKTDLNNPRIEYSENISSITEKKTLEISKIERFYERNNKVNNKNYNNKFMGIIEIIAKDAKETLNFTTYDENKHFQFISELNKYALG